MMMMLIVFYTLHFALTFTALNRVTDIDIISVITDVSSESQDKKVVEISLTYQSNKSLIDEMNSIA